MAELERLLGETLYDETGMLSFFSEESQYLTDSLATVAAAGLPARLLEPADAVRRYPAFSAEGVAAVLHDEAGGVLHARRATLGLARLARAAGVDLREGVAVRSAGDGVVELADGTRERADQVLIATGAWTSKLLDVPIRSTQQVNIYLRVPASGLPVWAYDLDVYGLTDDGGAGLKVGGHAIGADVDPDDPAAREAPATEVRRLVAAARHRLPGLAWPGPDDLLRGADVCCYALTPTEAPIIDRISERLVVCAGLSGHGFKFASALAPAAGDLVLGTTPEIDLTPFRRPALARPRASRRGLRSGAGSQGGSRARPARGNEEPRRSRRAPDARAHRQPVTIETSRGVSGATCDSNARGLRATPRGEADEPRPPAPARAGSSRPCALRPGNAAGSAGAETLMRMSATSGRENSTGGRSPRPSISRTIVPERKTCASRSCGHVLPDAIEPQTLQ